MLTGCLYCGIIDFKQILSVAKSQQLSLVSLTETDYVHLPCRRTAIANHNNKLPFSHLILFEEYFLYSLISLFGFLLMR